MGENSGAKSAILLVVSNIWLLMNLCVFQVVQKNPMYIRYIILLFAYQIVINLLNFV